MTLRKITMTNEIKFLTSTDMFSDNDILCLKRTAFSADVNLWGAEWSTEQYGQENAFLRVLSCALTKVINQLPDYDVWSLAGDSVWQLDSRVLRYRKQFNSLKMRGIDFEAIPERFELMAEKNGKIKFFGVVRINPSVFSTACLTMTPRAATYLVAKPAEQPWKLGFSQGWSRDWNDDASLTTAIDAIGGVVFQRFGFFDDQHVGLIAIGNPAALRRIVM
ncbi:hypothetical protein NDK50_33785 [Paraburkholderia bryophila]|uniref:hypothetical protein n=1 Tax=Paraburkholderia bryophila TaxID=420952 RepID=UPI00234A24C0|nr:hypothetical protein [Paraburkholderia bryophila]WCM22950.1 hypothetical protein NDK50_33785 [Paraburkholderia bryophila]